MAGQRGRRGGHSRWGSHASQDGTAGTGLACGRESERWERIEVLSVNCVGPIALLTHCINPVLTGKYQQN